MKTIPISLLLAGLMLPMAGAEPEGGRPGKGPRDGPRGERGFGRSWKQADVDNDGKVTLAEFLNIPRIQKLDEERRSHIFNRLDKNGDKVLEGEELAVMDKPPHDRQEAMLRFRELDTDNSGGVSVEELKSGKLFKKLPAEKQEALFIRLDTDKDGQITVKDRPPGAAGGQDKRMDRPDKPDRKFDRDGRPDKAANPKRILRDFDKDGDGALTFEEFRNAPPHAALSEDEQEDRFEAIDKNGDKKLDEADFPTPPQGKRPDGPPPGGETPPSPPKGE